MGMKFCSKCFDELPATVEFFYRDSQKKDGLRPDCKGCFDIKGTEYRKSGRGIKVHLKANNKYKKTTLGKKAERKYKATSDFKDKAKKIARRHRYKKQYGLTLKDYDKMLRQQKGKCLICDREPLKTRLCIDHDHTSGKVRGLLCHPCNLALGRFEKFIEQFNAYLRR